MNFRILAIDPGYEKMGVAVLEKPSGNNPRLADSAPPLVRGKPPFAKGFGGARETLLFSECFTTSRKDPHCERLAALAQEIARVIEKWKPECLAIEKLFFTTNQKTALLVAEARGAVIAEAARAGLSVTEFTPLQAKVAVTGYGRGTKEQVKYMVEKLITVGKKIKEDDEYDAIALGLTWFASEKYSLGKRGGMSGR